MNWLVTYDVVNDKRRGKIAKELEKHGVRINKSVFICLDSRLPLDALYQLLSKYASRKDSIYIFPLCKACAEKTVNLQHEPKTKREQKTTFI